MSDLDRAHVRQIIERHQESEGFCRCCHQPWPCDLRTIYDAPKAKV